MMIFDWGRRRKPGGKLYGKRCCNPNYERQKSSKFGWSGDCSRGFVDKIFQKSRERFGPKRKRGARKLKGRGRAAAGRKGPEGVDAGMPLKCLA
jgi:hypothetical protein